MIKLKILKISKSGSGAFCEAIKSSYGNSIVVASGNIKISRKLEIGSIHKTNFLTCLSEKKFINEKEYDCLLLRDEINADSAEINYLIFENNLQKVDLMIKDLIVKNDSYSKTILLQIYEAYMQYLHGKFDPQENKDFDLINEIQNVPSQINYSELSADFFPYIKKLSECKIAIRKPQKDIFLHDLTLILREENLIKIYYLDTVIKFGKYNQKKIEEVVQIDPGYIVSCIFILDHFCVSPIIVMLINVFDSAIDGKAILINSIKSQIKYVQDDVRWICKIKEKEEIEVYKNMLNDGMREAFNDDPSNLRNID